MRLLELTQRYPPAIGGVESTLGELVPRLVAAGIGVRVLTSDLARTVPFARLPSPVPTGPIPVERCRAVRALPLPLGLGVVAPGMLLRGVRVPVDVVHAHAFGYAPTWIGALLRRIRDVPLVVTTHADPGRGGVAAELFHRATARTTLRRADRVIIQSELERRFLTGLGVPPDRFVRIPSALSVAEFANDAAGPPPVAPPLRLVTVGRLEAEQKGALTLVDAIARIPASWETRAVWIGEDWGAGSRVRARARELGIGASLELRSGLSRAELRAVLHQSSIFVLPSTFESFPRALLEAMAAGLPIVATRVGGISEMVVEGRNALLVPPENPTALAEAITTLGGDAGLRARFARASRERARAFDWETVLPQYLDLFHDVMGRAARA